MTGAAPGPSSARISLPHLALLAPWVVVVIASFKTVRDNSYLWHIAAGRAQAGAGRVLTADPFSFTLAGEPWLTQSWLAELAYGFAHERFGIGYTGAMLLTASTVTFLGVGLLAFRRSAGVPATAIIMGLTMFLMVSFLVPRPVIFSFPLMVLAILAWESRTLRWALPFLFWLWASVHGSFAIGLVYIGIRLIADREWKALPTAVAAGLATLVTAHGLGVVSFLTKFAVARPHLALVSEWRTPDFVSVELGAFLVGLVVIIYGSMKGRLAPSSLWVIAPFLVLGMSATRAVPPAWIALVPVLAVSMSGLQWRFGRGFPRPVAVVAAVIILLFPFLLTSPVELDEERFPIEASRHLDDVRTFHDDSAGGYLIYAEQLSEGVFIDDRVELYLDRIDEYVDIRSGQEPWEAVFERDRIEQALLRAEEPMIGWLAAAGWQEVHRDDSYVVLRP